MEINPQNVTEVMSLLKCIVAVGLPAALIAFGCGYLKRDKGTRDDPYYRAEVHDHDGKKVVRPWNGLKHDYDPQKDGELDEWLEEGEAVKKADGTPWVVDGYTGVHRHSGTSRMGAYELKWEKEEK